MGRQCPLTLSFLIFLRELLGDMFQGCTVLNKRFIFGQDLRQDSQDFFPCLYLVNPVNPVDLGT